MKKYKCEICGKKHTIYRGIEVPFPRIVTLMAEEERAKRVKEFDGFCFVDDQLLFANGWINIEAENHEFPFFYWKTWTSVSAEQFFESYDDLKKGKVIELEGKLEEELLFYPNSKDLKTKTLIQATNEAFIIEIMIEEECQLKEDQSQPISENRMIEIMQMLHHYPKEKDGKKDNRPFKERFLKELESVEKEYLNQNKAFAIDISSGMVLFQIVNNKMLEINRCKDGGFGLHLSFDDSHEESKEEIAKFRAMEYSKEFDYHDLDEIPTYQLDLGMDIQRLEELVRSIVIDVYEEDIETVEVSSFEI